MTNPPRPNQITYVEFPAEPSTLTPVRDFFAAVFGWSYQAWGDDYADTSDSGVASGLNADAAHKTKRPLAVIDAPDLDATRSKIVEAGGRVTKEIFTFPGGRRFHFKDPAGNELAVWSDKAGA